MARLEARMCGHCGIVHDVNYDCVALELAMKEALTKKGMKAKKAAVSMSDGTVLEVNYVEEPAQLAEPTTLTEEIKREKDEFDKVHAEISKSWAEALKWEAKT